MTKPKRPTSPPHIVVPDTNILWHEHKGHAVCPEFDEFWALHAGPAKLQLSIPEVVLGELHFQQATSATKMLDRITETFSELSEIAASPYGHKIDHEQVKTKVGTKLDKWASSRAARIVKTPLSSIDWGAVVEAAVWRLPPFTADPKNPKIEKGFRDQLILETLCQISRENETANVNVVFLCNDNLLRETAKARLARQSNVLVFESLADFAAYLELTKQKLTDAFVRQIQVRAREKFYTEDDPSCLYLKEILFAKIEEKFKDKIAFPASVSPQSSIGLLGFGGFDLVSKRYWVSATRFAKLVGAREFHWTTRLTLGALYNQTNAMGTTTVVSTQAGQPSLLQSTQRLLQLGTDISWQANVKTDGRFHDVKLVQIALGSESFDLATPELLQEWGF